MTATQSWSKGERLRADASPSLQFPTLMHGGNVVVDSSCIWAYLADTYPEKMKVFQPDDPLACVPAPSTARCTCASIP